MPLGKRSVVTPRPSSSAGSSATKSAMSKQPKLFAGLKKMRQLASQSASQGASSTSQASLAPSASGKENLPRTSTSAPVASGSSSTSSNDERVVMGMIRPGGIHAMFGGPNAHQGPAKPSSNSLGKRILNPDKRRRGPTIDFDDSTLPFDDSEMDGESQRRKQARVIEGGRGELDLVPAGSDDDDGFGDASWRSDAGRRRPSKPVRMPLDLGPGSQHNTTATRAKSKPVPVRCGSPPPARATTLESSLGPEPSTFDDNDDENVLVIPSSQDEDEDEVIRRQLLPQRSEIQLVPDSDSPEPELDIDGLDGLTDDEYEDLPRAGAADDSGFAEMDGLDAIDARKKTEDLVMLPVDLVRSRKGQDAPRPTSSTTLSRTPSSVLMPPPPPPSARTTSAAPAPADRTPPRRRPGRHLRPDDLKFPEADVLVQATQYTLPESLATHDASPQAVSDACVTVDTPEASTKTHDVAPHHSSQQSIPLVTRSDDNDPSAPSASSVRRDPARGWNDLEAAWAGARPLSPPKPATPQQTRIEDFFVKTGAPRERQGGMNADEEDESLGTQLVPESQPAFLPLHAELALRDAIKTTVTMGRSATARKAAKAADQMDDEEIEDPELDCDSTQVVESSDPEDDPWSPLGSPVKVRFPPPPPDCLAVEEKDFKSATEKKNTSQLSTSQQHQAELETQWESYWTQETLPGCVPLVMDENDSMAYMLHDSYALSQGDP